MGYQLPDGHHSVDVFDLPSGDIERIDKVLGVPFRRWFDEDQPSSLIAYRYAYAAGNGITPEEAERLPGGLLIEHVTATRVAEDTDTGNPTESA